MLQIEYIDKSELKPYKKNAKKHSPEQIEQIIKSIKEFGFNDPVAVWKDNIIIEGHGRLLAALEMEYEEPIPIIRLDNLTDSQRKAYTLVHNKLTMNTDFDFDVLQSELEELTNISELDFDMSDFGFDLDFDISDNSDTPDDFKEFTEDIETKNKCPICGYEW